MGRLPTTLQMVFRLANSGKQTTKVHAFTNPTFETSSPGGKESTAITMQAADDLVEVRRRVGSACRTHVNTYAPGQRDNGPSIVRSPVHASMGSPELRPRSGALQPV